jgi:hypothetical protein
MKTAEEIRDYLLERLRLSIFKPCMCGGELGILNLFEYVTFADERSDHWQQHRKALYETKAFSAGGVMGSYQNLHWNLRGQHYSAVASVYARIAYEMGYLTDQGKHCLRRLLTLEQFESVLAQINRQDKLSDWVPEEVIEQFGDPSIRWGTNDYYPCTMLYLVDSHPEFFVCFDFWAEWFKDESGVRVPCKHGPKPILRNIRVPAATFPEQFKFSNFGSTLRNEAKSR